MKFKDLFYRETKTVVEWQLHSQTYRFNTNIILSAILIMLLLAVGILLKYEGLDGFNINKKLYVACDQWRCENPLFNNSAYCGKTIPSDDPICNKMFLVKGESFGEKPPQIFYYYGFIMFVGLLSAFVVNHFVMNKGFSFKKLNEEMNDGTK